MTIGDPNRIPIGRDLSAGERDEKPTRLPDLKPFADQLMMIAQHLRKGEFPTAHGGKASDPGGANSSTTPPSRNDFAVTARQIYAKRRRRGVIFGNPELFGEPAWDILLDLYIALADEKTVSVSSACIGSAAPPTTGLRWLGVLAENGLVVREQDPQDQRRVLVRLTDHGAESMDRYFATIAQH